MRANVERVRIAAESGAVSRQDLDDARAQLDVAQAELNIAEKAIEDSTIIAPRAGTISATYVEAFTSVRAKEAIAESYYLRGGIHEAAMQLQELAAKDDLDYYERSRITSRINELRMELAKLGLEED